MKFCLLYLDAIDRLLTNSLPWFGWVHELGILDLVLNVDIFVEGELTREGDIDDDPRRPHVQGSVEPFLLQPLRVEDLRGQIGRGAHDRLTERLLPDDTGIPKVAKLHLCSHRLIINLFTYLSFIPISMPNQENTKILGKGVFGT